MLRVRIGLLVAVLAFVQVESAAAQSGPAFCRSGQGHPVHGRSWCLLQGFELGGALTWRPVQWQDAVLGPERGPAGSRAVLAQVLDGVTLERLEAQRRRLSATESLYGRWLDAEGEGVVLQVFSGRVPVAELADLNGDGQLDLVIFNFGH